MTKEIAQFSSLELVVEAISIFADQNALTPKEIAEIFMAGSVATQAAGRELTGFPIMWGYLETAAQPSTSTKEVGND